MKCIKLPFSEDDQAQAEAWSPDQVWWGFVQRGVASDNLRIVSQALSIPNMCSFFGTNFSCNVARSLSLSGSRFPRLSGGGICLRRAPRILSTNSLEDKDCDKTDCRTALCSERSQTPSLVWTPTLCASSGHLRPRAQAASPPRTGDRSGHPPSKSKAGIRQTCKVGPKSGKCSH